MTSRLCWSLFAIVVALATLANASLPSNVLSEELQNALLYPESVVNWQPDLYEVCAMVGENTGCSGCVLGTKGLCDWVEISHSTDPTAQQLHLGAHGSVVINIPSSGVRFECLPAQFALSLSVGHPKVYKSARNLCPADSTKEPIIRKQQYSFDDGDVSASFYDEPLEFSESIVSLAHENKMLEFPSEPWVVDRTSRWGTYFHDQSLDCAAINRIDLATPLKHQRQVSETNFDSDSYYDPVVRNLLYMCPYQGSPSANGPFTGTHSNLGVWNTPPDASTPFWREKEKFCTRQLLSAYATTRCPQYGVAISGICQSAFIELGINCVDSHVEPQGRNDDIHTHSIVNVQTYGPSQAFPPPPLSMGHFLGYRVVDDSTQWCLNTFDVKASGLFEARLGLNKSLKDLNKFPTTECYDCCD